MMKRTCPMCGEIYEGVPAVSRKDNETLICPKCGTREALTAAFAISNEEVEHIVDAAYRSGHVGEEKRSK